MVDNKTDTLFQALDQAIYLDSAWLFINRDSLILFYSFKLCRQAN